MENKGQEKDILKEVTGATGTATAQSDIDIGLL